jgi:hypothetical protein
MTVLTIALKKPLAMTKNIGFNCLHEIPSPIATTREAKQSQAPH